MSVCIMGDNTSQLCLHTLSYRLRCCATNREVAGSTPAVVSGFFIDIKFFRSHYGPGVDSASNINEYQEHFLGGKGGRWGRLTTYHHPVTSRNLGTLTSWNPFGLFRPVMGLIYLSHCHNNWNKYGDPQETFSYTLHVENKSRNLMVRLASKTVRGKC